VRLEGLAQLNKSDVSIGKNQLDRHRGLRRDFVKVVVILRLEESDLLAESRNILNRWKKYFSQLLNVHRVSDVRQIEIHTAEPLVPDRNPFEVEIAIEDLNRQVVMEFQQN
jgi:hypothetical protein